MYKSGYLHEIVESRRRIRYEGSRTELNLFEASKFIFDRFNEALTEYRDLFIHKNGEMYAKFVKDTGAPL